MTAFNKAWGVVKTTFCPKCESPDTEYVDLPTGDVNYCRKCKSNFIDNRGRA